ncbi:hypothetical protein [Kaistia soli]|nr:hypothetical protein [Kaistia soli]
MSQSEVKAVDDIRFARRLNSRAEAIRFLIDEGMKSVAASSAPEAGT